ncbi:MAG TPA: nitrile hydratase accessory protein [Candidatus Limnocylindrales bacterium]|nr:nitrile hydratase accessory protein [Candidatus Limnocylindrales bacterium]
MSEVDRRVADLDGLPRKNGELVFEAPWQGRAFGMAVALHELGAYDWDEFRQRLVAEIGQHADEEYYASWLDAFEQLLLQRGTLTPDEIGRRTREFSSLERTEVF